VVPFSAIKSFFDPSVQFGLQFETSDASARPRRRRPRRCRRRRRCAVRRGRGQGQRAARPGEGAEVVRLDRFRKK